MKQPVILILDDNRRDVLEMERALVPALVGFARVETFTSPDEAVEATSRWARERRSLAVAVLVERPSWPAAVEIVERLRSTGPGSTASAVVVASEPGLDSVLEAANCPGIRKYIEKPLDSDELQETVRALLLRFLVERGADQAYLDDAIALARRSPSLCRRPGSRRARILGLGACIPPDTLTNADLERMIETTSEWILQRTGIETRHVVEPGTATSDLAIEAARTALAKARLAPEQLDAVLVATSTPDMRFPATACLVQHALGARTAWGFDVGAACCGFVYALATGAHLVETGVHDRVLIIGADVLTSITDYQDRATCVLFGDGAGAVVLGPTRDDDQALGVLDHALLIDGSGQDALKMPAGGSRLPATHETVDKRLHYLHQDGKAVFKFAVRRIEEMARLILDRNDLAGDEIDLFVPHQANMRIILAAAERLGMDRARVVLNLDRYGNTSAASIPLALADAEADGRLKPGGLILLVAVGAGFTMGGLLLRWG